MAERWNGTRVDERCRMAKPRSLPQTIASGSSGSSGPTGVQDPPSASANVHDRVAQRAYELYLERGGADGGDFDDWLAAEREVTGAYKGRPASEDRDE